MEDGELWDQAVKLSDGKVGMVTKGNPGKPWLVQVPGEELEREVAAAEMEPADGLELLHAAAAAAAHT